jgi:hypothetical protein
MPDSAKTNSANPIGRKMLLIIAFVFLLPIASILIAAISPVAARWSFLLLAAAAAMAILRPLPFPLLRTRLGAVGLLYLSCFGAASGFAQHTDAELEALKANSPSKYLEAIRGSRGDGAWLEALAEMRPDEYTAEVGRREQKEQERQAKLETKKAQREAERHAREQAKSDQRVASYVDQLHRELDGLPDFDVSGYTESRDSILLAVALFAAWANILEEGQDLPLSDEQEALRQRLRARVADVQSHALPRLRDAYGPATRRELWEHDMTAKTFGPGFTTVQFVAGVFAANRNIKAFNEGAWKALNMLRFKQVRYKWYEQDDKYTYYEIESPSDSELVVWAGNGGHRIVN